MEPTRRQMLRSALALAGGAVGFGVARKATSRTQTEAAAASDGRPPPTSLQLFGRSWRVVSDDALAATGPPDRSRIYGEIVDASGVRLGEFYGSRQRLDAPFDSAGRSSAHVEWHTFRLQDGTIHGMGMTGPGLEESEFAVVAGTGRYRGLAGSYVADQQPVEFGGNGSARFTMTFGS